MFYRYITLFTLFLLPFSAQRGVAQDLSALKKYADTYYQLEFDDDGNEVVNTNCEQPTRYLKIVYAQTQGSTFTYDKKTFKISEVAQGESTQELLIKYLNEAGETRAAIFYYDEAVEQLLFTFDEMNLAFVCKESLGKFKVNDTCDE